MLTALLIFSEASAIWSVLGRDFPDELAPTTTVDLFDDSITFSDIHQFFSRSARVIQ